MPDADDFDVDTYDAYISAQVALPKGDEMTLGTIVQRKRDKDGNVIGKHNENPILDTRVYEVEFSDGEVLEYSANIIAENLYAQVDEEGYHQVVFDDIVHHKTNKEAVKSEDDYVTINRRKCRRLTTKGWKLCVLWKDGSTSWEPLADMKESYPVQTAEYAVSNKIDQ